MDLNSEDINHEVLNEQLNLASDNLKKTLNKAMDLYNGTSLFLVLLFDVFELSRWVDVTIYWSYTNRKSVPQLQICIKNLAYYLL